MSILEWVAALVAILAWPVAITTCLIIVAKAVKNARDEDA